MRYTIFALFFALYGCVSMPKATHSQFDKIPTAAGPEDMVLDTVSCGKARLLLSCSDHRLNAKTKGKAPNGDIYVMNLDGDSLEATRLYRAGEPAGLHFHPHGIYLCSDTSQRNHFLYVVSHNELQKRHSIYKYKIMEDSLVFVRQYEHALIHSPNSVAALPNGGFYVSNDAGKRNNRIEALLRLRRSTIVYCDENGKCAEATERKVSYANGLCITDNHYVYLGTTRQNRVFRYTIEYDGNLIDRQEVAKVAGGDNVRCDQGDVYIAAHLRILAFVGHFSKPEKLSPTVVYKIDANGSQSVVYATKGEQISAGSTALPYKGYLYVGQVFNPFIVRVKL